MSEWKAPTWVTVLSEEDLLFLKRFLLSSGSLKKLAEVYGVTYPTIRGRLDRLIERVNAVESPVLEDSFERLVDALVSHGVMVSGTGRTLLQAHKRILRETAERAARVADADTPDGEWQE